MQNRKSIDLNNCREIGFIKKTHGIQGDLLLAVESGLADVLEIPQFLFIEIEGLPVPFHVEMHEWRGDETISVHLRYVDSKEKARELTGCKIFVDANGLNTTNTDFHPNLLRGFTVFDQKMGKIGEIIEVNDFGGNLVFTVSYLDGEVLIPFNEDLLLSFDQETSTIIMDCPEGLFDLTD